MSKSSKIIRAIEIKRKRKTKGIEPALAHTVRDDDDPSGFRSVRADTVWWLLSMHLIERHEYFACREMQGSYLTAQLQPPRCLMGRGAGWTFGGVARQFDQYPNEQQFAALRRLATIRRKVGRVAYRVLENTLCHYWAQDDRLTDSYTAWIRNNIDGL